MVAGDVDGVRDQEQDQVLLDARAIGAGLGDQLVGLDAVGIEGDQGEGRLAGLVRDALRDA